MCIQNTRCITRNALVVTGEILTYYEENAISFDFENGNILHVILDDKDNVVCGIKLRRVKRLRGLDEFVEGLCRFS